MTTDKPGKLILVAVLNVVKEVRGSKEYILPVLQSVVLRIFGGVTVLVAFAFVITRMRAILNVMIVIMIVLFLIVFFVFD